MLSEEGDLLLDSPALEVSDSESDEALVASPEGRVSEAGTWEPVVQGGGRGLQLRWERGRRTTSSQAPAVRPAPRALVTMAPVGPWAQASTCLCVPWCPTRTAVMTGRVSGCAG